MSFPNGTTEHPINKSGKNKILVSVWDFGATRPQSERSHYLCNDHPAKMRPSLAKAVLQIYGESPVLDPMAGIGTTLVEASLLGMDAVGIEFEKKFVGQANKNLAHVKKLFPNEKLGKAVCLRGDARDLSGLNLPTVNSIFFSPPYFNALSVTQSKAAILYKESNEKLRMRRSETFAVRRNLPIPYSSDEGNIGNVGQFGSIVFSPPYCGVMDAQRHVGGISSRDKSLAKTALYSKDASNLGNVRSYGNFGSIVFSPPFGEANRGGGIAKKGYEGKHGKDKALKDRCDRPLSDDQGNIGNSLYGRTYLGEMFKVYSECFRVLKPGKFMVVVVKDIRRRGLTIPLGCDTTKLCQLVGFDLFDIIVNKMYFLSFWQLSYAKKMHDKEIPMTLRTHEYVLVFRKPETKYTQKGRAKRTTSD